MNAYNEDSKKSTHPVACSSKDTDEAEDNFGSLTYGKGSSLLKQIF